LKDAIQQATEAVEQVVTAMDEAQENYELLLPAHCKQQQQQQNVGANRQNRNNQQHFQRTLQQREAQEELQELTDCLKAKEGNLQEKEVTLATWKIGKLVNFDGFMAHG
jgi:hypothetical protein